jgi:transcriptional regulator with XRE-family HTH domain
VGYRGLIDKQNQARDLRAAGWTMPDIAAKLGVSRSSVSLWTHDVPFEPRPRQRARRRGPNKLQVAKEAEIAALRAEGLARVGELSEPEFLMAGIALYAGEGSKTDGAVQFANSDPRMIAFFVAWLRRFFAIDESRLRVSLYLHQGLDLEAAQRFWSEVTGIPADAFGKPYRAVPDPSIRTSKHPMGCPRVGYSCSRTHRAIMGLVSALLSSEASFRGGAIGSAGDC